MIAPPATNRPIPCISGEIKAGNVIPISIAGVNVPSFVISVNTPANSSKLPTGSNIVGFI